MYNCYVRFVKTCTFDGLYKVHHVAIAPASLQYHQERYNVAFVLWCKYTNPLTSNDPYRGRTAPLTSKRFILYIYSTNIGTEYFKHDIYSPFFSLQNAVCFIILTIWFMYYSHFIYRCAKN